MDTIASLDLTSSGSQSFTRITNQRWVTLRELAKSALKLFKFLKVCWKN